MWRGELRRVEGGFAFCGNQLSFVSDENLRLGDYLIVHRQDVYTVR